MILSTGAGRRAEPSWWVSSFRRSSGVHGHSMTILFGGDTMLLKQCNKCGKPCAYPASYCPKCLPGVLEGRAIREAEAKARGDRLYNSRRDPKYKQFYRSKQWRMLSSRYMQDRGWMCEECRGLAVEVHHMQPIQTPEGWERRFDVTNLKAVCVDCHNKEHKRFQRKEGRRSQKP